MNEPHPPPTGPTLIDWSGWWIETRCRCRVTFLPVRLLAERYGPNAHVAHVAQRLRCSHCHEHPTMRMVDDPRGLDEFGAAAYGPAHVVPVPTP